MTWPEGSSLTEAERAQLRADVRALPALTDEQLDELVDVLVRIDRGTPDSGTQ